MGCSALGQTTKDLVPLIVKGYAKCIDIRPILHLFSIILTILSSSSSLLSEHVQLLKLHLLYFLTHDFTVLLLFSFVSYFYSPLHLRIDHFDLTLVILYHYFYNYEFSIHLRNYTKYL